MVCCTQKNIDGCYECPELEDCTKGFYTPDNDGAASAKSQAMFIVLVKFNNNPLYAYLGIAFANKICNNFFQLKTTSII